MTRGKYCFWQTNNISHPTCKPTLTLTQVPVKLTARARNNNKREARTHA